MIRVHGTLEILSLVIAATAGFVIAQGILFPGTYARMLSFRRGIKDALKIMIVLVPIFIAASFFESFVTHLMGNTFGQETRNGLPIWSGALILAASLSFITWYFVIYPIRLHKQGFQIQKDGKLKIPLAKL